MGYFEGLLGGFTGRKREIEQQRYEEGLAASAREEKIFNTLLSSPDEEVQALAVTGLLESARPRRRRGGLRGWMGELEESPSLSRIQEIIASRPMETVTEQEPVMVQEGARGLPSKQIQPAIGMTAGAPSLEEAPMGTPSTSMTEPGAPPPQPIAYTETPGPEVGRPPVYETRTTARQRPRRIFPTRGDVLLEEEIGRARGKIRGQVEEWRLAGIPENEIKEMLKAVARRQAGGAAPFQAIAGEIVNPDGTTAPAFGVFNKQTSTWEDINGAPLTGFRPRQPGGGYRYGQLREAIAQREFGRSFGDLNQQEAGRVLELEKVEVGALSASRAKGTEQGQFEGPIDVRTAQQTGTTVGATSQQYSGQRVPTAQERLRGQNAQNVRGQLQRIRGQLGVLPRQADVVGGQFPGAIMTAKRLGRDTRAQVAQLESAINNIRAVLTRTMQANVGTETEKDAERALTTLVNLHASIFNPAGGDTQESAMARIDETIKYLDQVMQTIPAAPVPNQIGNAPPAPGATAAPGTGAAAPGRVQTRKTATGGWELVIP